MRFFHRPPFREMKNLVECFLLRGPSEWVLATGEHEPGQGFAPAAISVTFRVSDSILKALFCFEEYVFQERNFSIYWFVFEKIIG